MEGVLHESEFRTDRLPRGKQQFFLSREAHEQWAATTPDIVFGLRTLDESPDLRARLLEQTEPLGGSAGSHDVSGDDCFC